MKQSLAYCVSALRKDFTEYCNRRLQKIGLSQGLLYFLLYIGHHPGCAPKEVAAALKMDAGHTMRSLGKLQQGGFLWQAVNPSDKRAHILNLTEKGTEALKESKEMISLWEEEVMGKMTEEERRQVLSLLSKLADREGDYFCV